MEEPIRVKLSPKKPPRRNASTVVMLTALGMFLLSWPLIYLVMSSPIFGNDLIGLLLYFSGPLPILSGATFLIGYGMLLCGR